jgi:hypothetical protein
VLLICSITLKGKSKTDIYRGCFFQSNDEIRDLRLWCNVVLLLFDVFFIKILPRILILKICPLLILYNRINFENDLNLLMLHLLLHRELDQPWTSTTIIYFSLIKRTTSHDNVEFYSTHIVVGEREQTSRNLTLFRQLAMTQILFLYKIKLYCAAVAITLMSREC